MLLPTALGSSPHPPVSVFGTGTVWAIAAFLARRLSRFPTPFRSASRFPVAGGTSLPCRSRACPRPHAAAAPCRLCPRSSAIQQYRNLCLLSIGYASRPRLRPRLPQGRSALPWNPWIFGLGDSRPHLATHSGILPPPLSTAPPGTASSWRGCSPTDAPFKASRGFGAVFQPRTFSARDLSASELLRTLSMYGCF